MTIAASESPVPPDAGASPEAEPDLGPTLDPGTDGLDPGTDGLDLGIGGPNPTGSRATTAARRSSVRQRISAIGRPPRIMGLDIARGLAIAGMVAAHMASAPEVEWAHPSTWAGLVHGRSAILFALLAGVSTALLTGRTVRPGPEELPAARARMVRRGVAIFVIGLVLELLNTNIAIILCVYGVLFLCAVPVLRWRVRSLVIASVVMALAGPLLLATVQTLAFGPFGPGVSLVFYGVYPVPVWLAFMLAGLAVGRCRFTTAKAAAVILGVGIVISAVGYTAGAFAARHFGDGSGPGGKVAVSEGKVTFGDGPALSGAGDVSPGSAVGVASGDGAAGPAMSASAGTATTGDGAAASGMTDSGATGSDPGYSTIPGSELADSLDALEPDAMTCDVSAGNWINCYRPDDSKGYPPADTEQSYWERLSDSQPVHTVLSSALAVGEHSGGTPEILGSGGFALAVLGLCLLLARPLRWLLLPVACLGMMPLTTYSAHVVVYLLLSGGPGGFFDASWAIWGWTVGGLAAFAVLWTVFFGRGPLERLLARVARVPRAAAPQPAPGADPAQPAPGTDASVPTSAR